VLPGQAYGGQGVVVDDEHGAFVVLHAPDARQQKLREDGGAE
jgi:hypothetical protein